MVEETSLMMLTKTRCDSFYLGYLLVKAFVCSHHWSKGFSLFLHFFLVVNKSFTTYHLDNNLLPLGLVLVFHLKM